MKKVMFAVVALIMSVSVAFAAEGDFLPQPVGTNGPAITAFRLSRLETELPNVEVPVRDQQKALAAVTSGAETEESEEDSEATENVESTFEIKKATTSVAEAYSSHDVGRLQIPSVGVDIAIRYSLEQADVDAVGMGASYDISVLPGDPTGSAVFGDHNFQTGKLFASLNPGDEVIVDAHYGQFKYIMESARVAHFEDSATFYAKKSFTSRRESGRIRSTTPGLGHDAVFDDGSHFYKNIATDGKGDLYLVTCWPLDALVTNEILVTRCIPVEGTQFVD